MKKVFISTSSFGAEDSAPIVYLHKYCEVAVNPLGRKLTKAELIENAQWAEGIIAGTEMIDEEVIKNLPKLKVISRCGAGLDNVDIESAERAGIQVYNTPFGPTLAVAELAVGLMLDLLRMVTRMNNDMKVGVWKKRMGNQLFGKKVGIIGFGRIGKKVAELLGGFGAEVAYNDIQQQEGTIFPYKTLNEIFQWSDIITLHLSNNQKNSIINKETLSLMKQGSWLVNTSRGELVDEDALYLSLSDGQLAGAALDVFIEEPYKGKLLSLSNIVLTPHIGSYAQESRIQMEMDSVNNLLKGLRLY